MSLAALNLAALPGLFGHFMLWSLLSVGGAIGLLPDMHRYLVDVQHWVTDAQFNAALALGQASPGPNMILFAALLGWHVAGLVGALAGAIGLILPSTLITLAYFRYSSNNPGHRWIRAIHDGLAPVTVGLLLSSGWLLAAQNVHALREGFAVAVVVLLSLWTRINPLWLLLGGAAAGALGWI
jgi:chromate transporter